MSGSSRRPSWSSPLRSRPRASATRRPRASAWPERRRTRLPGNVTGTPTPPEAVMDERAVALVGRDHERARVDAFLASPHPAALVIEGEPGIGKTTLWRYGVEQAERRGWRVLAFRPGEAERTLTFAGLAGLFPDALLDEVLPHIPEPR